MAISTHANVPQFRFEPTKNSDLETSLISVGAIEVRWEQAFANSQDALVRLADEALANYREGRTQILDPDEL
jgi:hypothetical protein